MRVNGNISDLFFNSDGANTENLCSQREAAVEFLHCLHRLGIEVPTVDELLEDYQNRL